MSSKNPRGIRNNNPLNIRIGNTWLGEVPNPTDSDFEQFISPVFGLRAGFCILRRYIRRYGRNTIRKIVGAWAPPVENNTDMYVGYVSQRVGIDPDAPIDFADADVMCRLVSAMAHYECGRDVSEEEVRKAYKIV